MNGGPFSPRLVRIRVIRDTGESTPSDHRLRCSRSLPVRCCSHFRSAPAHAQPMARALVLPASAEENAQYSRASRKPELGVVRQKPVAVDVSALDDAKGVPPDQLRVDLFDNRSVTIARDRIERRSATSFTWHGKVSGHPEGFALLTIVDGEISGVIDVGDAGTAPQRRYQIESTNDGLTLLREIDDAGFPPDHPGGGEPVAPRVTQKSVLRATRDAMAGDELLKSDSAATIDVMVVYSNQTAAAAGTAIGAQIQQAVDTANLVYANSGITTRLRLVHYEQVELQRERRFPDGLEPADHGRRRLHGQRAGAAQHLRRGSREPVRRERAILRLRLDRTRSELRVQRDQPRLRIGQLQLSARARTQLRRAPRHVRRFVARRPTRTVMGGSTSASAGAT